MQLLNVFRFLLRSHIIRHSSIQMDDHIIGMIISLGQTTDDHIAGMITINKHKPRSR